MDNIIIIGGGLSGLSAAVELSALGYKVQLYEQRRTCGGRASSYFDRKTGGPFDNGQHLMMGCYKDTRRYMRLIGTGHLVSLQPSLHINYIGPRNNLFTFSCPKLPAPLHLIGGLLNFDIIPLIDRLKMLGLSTHLMQAAISKENKLDQISAESWLEKIHQSNISRKYFWDIITIGALNNDPRNVSALMLYRVLRAAFLGKRENSSLLIPDVELTKCLIEPAVQFISTHGGNVYTGIGIRKMNTEGTKIGSVETMDGRRLFADNFISTVPWYAAKELLPLHNIDYDKYQSSPIICIHLWLDRRITDVDFAALPGMRIQWMFNKTRSIISEESTNNGVERQHLSLVISGAQEYIDLQNKDLIQIAREDLQQVLPQILGAKILKALVIKERQATFLPSPGLEKIRPDARTKFNNLFLAGDWTATGYPATIEGAVSSGKKAAESIHYRQL